MAYAQQPAPVFHEDFQNGIPDTFTLMDFDGHTPDPDLNFPKGKAWASWTDPDDAENLIAASVSWYDHSGCTANDWMITPVITLPADSAACQLYWRSRSAVSTFMDAYQVAVATDTDQKADVLAKTSDKWMVVKQISNSQNLAEWKTYKVDLSNFRGRTIYLAFINVTTDGWMCYVDDITVGEEASVNLGDVRIQSLPFAADGKATIKADLHVGILNKLTSFTARLTSDADTLTETISGNYDVNKHYSLTLNNQLPGDETATRKYKLELLNDTILFATDSSEVTYTKSLDGQLCVVAEGLHDCTDSYGPRMIEGFKWAKEQLGDRFLGFQLHTAEYDPLRYNASQRYYKLLKNFDLIPNQTVVVGRKATGDVYDQIESLCEDNLNRILLATPQIEGEIDDEEMTIQAKCTFAIPLENQSYSYEIIVTEDTVWTTQSNMYAGGDLFGKFCGYENYPLNANIPVNNVVRAVFSSKSMTFNKDTQAGEEVVLEAIVKDFEQSSSERFDCAEPRNLFASILIIDDATGEIINAARSKMVYTGNKPVNGIVDIADCQTTKIEVFDLNGRKVTSYGLTEDSDAMIPAKAHGSLFIIKKVSNGETQTYKVHR